MNKVREKNADTHSRIRALGDDIRGVFRNFRGRDQALIQFNIIIEWKMYAQLWASTESFSVDQSLN